LRGSFRQARHDRFGSEPTLTGGRSNVRLTPRKWTWFIAPPVRIRTDGGDWTGRDSNSKWLFGFPLKVVSRFIHRHLIVLSHKRPLDHHAPEKVGRIGAFWDAWPVLRWSFDERKAPLRGLSRYTGGNYSPRADPLAESIGFEPAVALCCLQHCRASQA